MPPSSSVTSRRPKTKAAAPAPATTPSPSHSPSAASTPRQSQSVEVRAASSTSPTPTTTTTTAAPLYLSAEELQQTPDNRLLSYLMECSNAVRGIALRPILSATSTPSLSVAAAAAASAARRDTKPFTSAFVEALLTPRLLFSAIPDVSQLVACLLCDAVRLHHQQYGHPHHPSHSSTADDSATLSPSNTSGSTAPPFGSPGRVLASQQTAESDIAAGVAPLPFASSRCVDVLRCLTGVFAALHPPSTTSSLSFFSAAAGAASTTATAAAATGASPLSLKRAAYLIERAAVSHVFRYLLPHCPLASEETQHALQCVFDAVRCATVRTSSANVASPPGFVSRSGSTGGSGMTTAEGRASGGGPHRAISASASAATCNEMAQLLSDILVSTGDITTAQLTPLLEELAVQHSAKALWTAAGSSSSSSSGTSSSLSQLQGGARITARVLLEHTDVALQPAIAAWATGEFDDGLEELQAAEVLQEDEEETERGGVNLVNDVDSNNGEEEGRDDADGQKLQQPPQQRTRGSVSFSKPTEAQFSHRCAGLKKVARVLEVLVALTELSVDLVEQVVPVLAPHLEHPNADLRVLLVRGFGALFAAHDAAVSAYPAIFMGPFLNRFLDAKPNIRMEALRISAALLGQCAVRSGGRGYGVGEHDSCAAQQARLWTSFQPCWVRLLTDPHVLVRKQAVNAVTDAALAAPLLFSQPMPPQQRLQQKLPSHLSRMHEADLSFASDAARQASPSAFLAQTLGLRTRDKNKRVRDAAVDGLTRLYHAYQLAWIPNNVLDAPRVEAASGSSTSAQSSAPVLAEVVVEHLLPSPSAVGAPGRQSTLTRWMEGGADAATTPATSRTIGSGGTSTSKPNLALFDFEQTDERNEDDADIGNNNNHHNLRVKNEPVENSEDEARRWEEGDALLGIQPRASAQRSPVPGASIAKSTASSVAAAAAADLPAARTSYVDGLLHLCQSVDTTHFTQLLRLSEKKPQLRRAVQKLFEFHAAVKASNGDVKSAEGQQRINAIHRLLQFLQDTTGAMKGEWDAVFRAKDDAVRKALLRACDPALLDTVEVRETVLCSLQGRLGASEFAFVKHALLPQLLFPVQPAHVAGLMQRLHRSIYISERAEVVVNTPVAVAVLRALLLLTAATPAYARHTAAGLAEALQAAAKQSAAPPPVWCALLLQALQQWATAIASDARPATSTAVAGAVDPSARSFGDAATRQTSSSAPAEVAVLSADQRRAMVQALQSMALATLPMQQIAVMKKTNPAATPTTTTPSSSPFVALKQLAKQATRTLLALVQVPGFERDAAAAVQSLTEQLTHQLGSGRALTNDAKTVAWLASVQALSTHPRASEALRPNPAAASTTNTTPALPGLLPHLRTLLLAAVADVSDGAEHAKLAKPQNSISHTSASTTPTPQAGASDGSGQDAHGDAAPVALPAAPATLTSTASVAAAIVDGAAKALTRLALSCPAASPARASAVAHAMESLLQAYKAVANLTCGRAGPASVGCCQRRLAVEKQLVKLLATPSADLAKEMAAAVVLSVEAEAQVREVVQHKLSALLLQRSCDMRVAALLLLTAISEETKSSYQRLRSVVESVGDHLRAKQASQGVSLSSPAAFCCYWEYTIPFLVLFLAHHPYYASEAAETQFVSFQRVWHLLIGELFRHGTQCAGFVVELLGKLKQSDDALDPASDATRVMCDLGSRVLLECLGQRQSRAEDLRRYPGAILIPSFFVKTAQPSPQKVLETVYLSDSVRVAPNAPFRIAAPAGSGAAGPAGGNGGDGSRGSSRQSTPRAASVPEGVANAVVEDGRGGRGVREQHGRTPSTQRKRQRSRSAKASAMREESPAVSLSPSLSSELVSTQGTARRNDVARTDADAVSAPSSQRVRAESEFDDDTAAASTASADVYVDSDAHTNATHEDNEVWREEEEEDDARSDDATPHSMQREAVQKSAVDAALRELFTGLTKTQIAQLRWKVVRGRLEEALQKAEADFDALQTTRTTTHREQHHGAGTKVGAESNLEELLQYAKEQLRVWYNDAPA